MAERKGVIESLITAPYKIIPSIPEATEETIESIKKSFKKPSVSGVLFGELETLFFPAEILSKAVGKAYEKSLKEAGVSEKTAKQMGDVVEIVSGLIMPYSVLSAGKKISEATKLLKYGEKYKEIKKAEEATKALRREKFLEELKKGAPTKKVEYKLPEELAKKFEELRPRLKGKTTKLLTEVYPKKKKVLEKEFGYYHRQLASILEDTELTSNLTLEEFENLLKTAMKQAKRVSETGLDMVFTKHPHLKTALFTQDEIKLMFEVIKNSNLNYSEKLSSIRGLWHMAQGKVPFPKDVYYLKKVLGEDTVSALKTYQKAIKKAPEGSIVSMFNEIFYFPRAVMASYDLSALLRQGLPFIGRKEWLKSARIYAKAFKEENYNKILASIVDDEFFPLAKRFKLGLAELGSMTQGEELFLSRLAKKIPGIEASERGYTAFLNKLRFDLFKDWTIRAVELGYHPDKNPEIFERLAKYINVATGRGELPPMLPHYLSWVFFAPRLLVSRFQLPYYGLRLPKEFRIEFARDIASMGAYVFTIISLAKVIGGEEVEIVTDPRNSDFLKIKKGDIRFDIFGGYQQEAVLVYRLYSGEMISSTTGKPASLGKGYGIPTRGDTALNFLRNKLHPIAGAIWDYLFEKGYASKPLDDYREIAKSMIPFIFQDVWEVAERDPTVVPFALLGGIGWGVQAYSINDHLKWTRYDLGIPEEWVKAVDNECSKWGYSAARDFSVQIGSAGERLVLEPKKLQEAYKTVYTGLFYKGLYSLINSSQYQALPDDQKQKLFLTAMKKIRTLTKKIVFPNDTKTYNEMRKLVFKYLYALYRKRGIDEKTARMWAKEDADKYIKERIESDAEDIADVKNIEKAMQKLINNWQKAVEMGYVK